MTPKPPPQWNNGYSLNIKFETCQKWLIFAPNREKESIFAT